MTSILLTTDFSDLARRAYPHALRLARALGLPVRLLNVFDTLAQLDPGPPLPGSWQARIVESAESHLEEEAKRLRQQGAEVDVVFRIGFPAIEIAREALSGAAAIVMATHGHGGFRRFFLGSTTTKVLRTASVPVLTVGPDAPDRDVRHVLMPVDLGEASTSSVPEAMALVRAYGASVELYHAVIPHWSPLLVPALGVEVGALEETPEDRRLRVEAGLGRVEAACAGYGVTTSTAWEDGARAAESICARAELWDADLVMLPAHGARGFARVLLGSVTEEVVRRCGRPVMVLRPPYAQVA